MSSVVAQSRGSIWGPPANLSMSGAASQPAIVTGPSGTTHAIWWDSTRGALYSTIVTTDTVWSAPASLPFLFGQRNETTEPGGRRVVTLVPPRVLRLQLDNQEGLIVLWVNTSGALLSSSLAFGRWDAAQQISELVTAFDLTGAADQPMHLVYVSAQERQGLPVGVYHASRVGRGWGRPQLVYASPYFRSSSAEQLNVSIAVRATGEILITWDDPYQGRSLFSRSVDAGVTWSTPEPVAIDPAVPSSLGTVVAVPNGDILLLWRDPSSAACRIFQRKSSDGGASWAAPEAVLGDMSLCPARWSFPSSADGKVWLLGSSQPIVLGGSRTSGVINVANRGVLASWNGSQWSLPAVIGFSVNDPGSELPSELSCLSLSLAGQTLAIAGCDSRGDVWAARNSVPLDEAVVAARTVWDDPVLLSGQAGKIPGSSLPALGSATDGRVVAIWGETETTDTLNEALFAAVWADQVWTGPAAVLRTPLDALDPNVDGPIVRAQQPALAIDARDRVHVVWTSAGRGAVFYSWASVVETLAPQTWSRPVEIALSNSATGSRAPARASGPAIAAHPRSSDLYVAFAVGYNERRGIYVQRSPDGGSTWLSPTLAFNAAQAGWDSVDKPALAIDAESNVLHLTWLRTSMPNAEGARGVYYARSSDMGQTWSEPVMLAQGQADWPRLAAYAAGQVYAAWTVPGEVTASGTTQLARVWGSFSSDSGQQWSDPAQVGGLEVDGGISLVTDSTGHLYMTGVGRTASGEGALAFVRWNGAEWEDRDNVPLGQLGSPGNTAVAAVQPQVNRLAVALQIWSQQADGNHGFELVATGKTVEVAAVQPAATYTPVPAGEATPTALVVATDTPQPSPTAPADLNTRQSGGIQGGDVLLLSGVAAAVAVVLGLIGSRRLFRRSR